jgi:anaerobic magnesium-protoporphyrin IX monomethyl ester cyclase
MDILLINPKYPKARQNNIMPPLGLASIGCALEKNGFTVSVLDLELEPEDFDLFTHLAGCPPKIVGISGTSHSRFESFRIARIAKNVSREIATVYGGCHATFTAEDTLSNVEAIDYIVHGEGEATFLELARSILSGREPLCNIRGISYRENGRVKRTAARERIGNLDEIPYSRHLLRMERYDLRLDFLDLPAMLMMTSRGCPYRCYFCSASAMFGSVYTKRSAGSVAEEIEYGRDTFGIRGIKFFDSTLTLERAHIEALIREFTERRIDIPWECEIRADTVDKELLTAMKEAGCYYVDMGMESASEKLLKTMGKKITVEKAVTVLKWCRELDLKTKVFFTFGHIGETWRDARETLLFIERHLKLISKPAIIRQLKIFPGTLLEQRAVKEGILPGDFSWSKQFQNERGKGMPTHDVPIVMQRSFGAKEIRRLSRIKKKILRHKQGT